MNSMKRQKDRALKDELPRWVGAHYATGEEPRSSSRRNEEAEPKQKQRPAVDVPGGESKVQCCKEQYCVGTQNGWVMVKKSDKTWFIGEGNGKPFQYSRLENPTNSMKRQKDMTLEDEPPSSEGV